MKTRIDIWYRDPQFLELADKYAEKGFSSRSQYVIAAFKIGVLVINELETQLSGPGLLNLKIVDQLLQAGKAEEEEPEDVLF